MRFTWNRKVPPFSNHSTQSVPRLAILPRHPKTKRGKDDLGAGGLRRAGPVCGKPGRALFYSTRALQNSTQPPTRVCDPVRSKNAALGVFRTPGDLFCPLVHVDWGNFCQMATRATGHLVATLPRTCAGPQDPNWLYGRYCSSVQRMVTVPYYNMFVKIIWR